MTRDFIDAGLSRKHVLTGLKKTRAGLGYRKADQSKSWYILDPTDQTLWDLKITIGNALSETEFAGNSTLYQSEKHSVAAASLGFARVRFLDKKKRDLGVNGFNPAELDFDHEYYPEYSNEPDTGRKLRSSLGGTVAGRRKSHQYIVVRNSAVVAEALRQANGVCQACGERAFKTPLGNWYLEVHHKIWLSEDGPDTLDNVVALCPNCHRKEHHGSDRKFGVR